MKRYEFGMALDSHKEKEIVTYADEPTEEQLQSDFDDWLSGRVDSWCVLVEEESDEE